MAVLQLKCPLCGNVGARLLGLHSFHGAIAKVNKEFSNGCGSYLLYLARLLLDFEYIEIREKNSCKTTQHCD
jgi:hypothetical protein